MKSRPCETAWRMKSAVEVGDACACEPRWQFRVQDSLSKLQSILFTKYSVEFDATRL
jgi:hypothetical protein